MSVVEIIGYESAPLKQLNDALVASGLARKGQQTVFVRARHSLCWGIALLNPQEGVPDSLSHDRASDIAIWYQVTTSLMPIYHLERMANHLLRGVERLRKILELPAGVTVPLISIPELLDLGIKYQPQGEKQYHDRLYR